MTLHKHKRCLVKHVFRIFLHHVCRHEREGEGERVWLERGQIGLSHARSRNSTWSGPSRSRPFKTSAALLASNPYSFSFLVLSSYCQPGTPCPSCAEHTYSAVLGTTDTNARLTLARSAPASLRPLLLAPFLATFSYLASLNAPSPRVVCIRDRLLGLHRSTFALACPRLARLLACSGPQSWSRSAVDPKLQQTPPRTLLPS